MKPDVSSVREYARRAVETALGAGAEQAEALVSSSSAALTRFANNRIHQNVAAEDVSVSVRSVVGRRVGVASTNRTDDGALADGCAAAVDAARLAPEDPDFPGLPAPRPVSSPDRVAMGSLTYGAEQRAAAAGDIIAQSSSRGLTAAGTVYDVPHDRAVHGRRDRQWLGVLRWTRRDRARSGVARRPGGDPGSALGGPQVARCRRL
jgi:hypothetical protein